jgi:hypothetical protein
MNKELKAEIIRKYGAQFPFAAVLGIREATVSAVIRGHHILDDVSKRMWAEALGIEDYERLFQGAGNDSK